MLINSDVARQNFHRMLDLARTELPGVADKGLKQQVFEVLHEFFSDSSAWTEDIPFQTIANQQTYPLAPVAGGQIVRLGGVFDGNFIMIPADMPVVGSIVLRDPPSNVQTFTATVIKSVVLSSGCADGTDFPYVADHFLDLYLTWLACGLKGQMMNQPAKPYSNEKLAVYNLKRFRDGIARARIAAIRRNTYGVNAWRYPQTFNTRSQRGGVSVGNANTF